MIPLIAFVVSCTSLSQESSTSETELSEQILFASASANTGFELFTINPDGSDLIQLTHLNNLINGFSPSPDGKYIAFRTFPDGFSTNLVLHVMRSDGSDITQLTDNTIGGIFWSPDSHQIAFISKRDGFGELYTIDVDGSNEHRLTYGATDKFMNDVYSASWSPDGQKILFIRLDELYLVDINGNSETALLSNGHSKYGAHWIGSDQTITFAMTTNDQTAVYTMTSNGSELTKAVDLPSQFTGFSWSPDMRYIIYTPKKNGKISATLVNVSTGIKTQISEDISGISWSPDSKHIVYIDVSGTRQKTMRIIDLQAETQYSFVANNIYNDNSPKWVELGN